MISLWNRHNNKLTRSSRSVSSKTNPQNSDFEKFAHLSMSISRLFPQKRLIYFYDPSFSAQFLILSPFYIKHIQKCKKTLFLTGHSIMTDVCIAHNCLFCVKDGSPQSVNLLPFVDEVVISVDSRKTMKCPSFFTVSTLEIQSHLFHHSSFWVHCLVFHHKAHLLVGSASTVLGEQFSLLDKSFPVV